MNRSLRNCLEQLNNVKLTQGYFQLVARLLFQRISQSVPSGPRYFTGSLADYRLNLVFLILITNDFKG